MAHAVIDLHPDQLLSEEIDFTDDLPLDTSITVTTSSLDSAGDAASINQSNSENGMVTTLTLGGGEDGEDYTLTITALGDVSSDIAVKVYEVRCRANQGMF